MFHDSIQLSLKKTELLQRFIFYFTFLSVSSFNSLLSAMMNQLVVFTKVWSIEWTSIYQSQSIQKY